MVSRAATNHQLVNILPLSLSLNSPLVESWSIAFCHFFTFACLHCKDLTPVCYSERYLLPHSTANCTVLSSAVCFTYLWRMDCQSSDCFRWDPPEEMAPPVPCTRCIDNRVGYRRCRMSFGSDCMAADSLTPSVICGLSAWSSGQPKICQWPRMNVRVVDTYCLDWNHYKFSFHGELWKCCACHQDGQHEETCRMCAHRCCRQCTQGRYPRGSLRQLPVDNVPSHATQRRPERGCLASGAAYQPLMMQGQGAVPLFPDATPQIRGLAGDGVPSCSGPADRAHIIQDRGAMLSFSDAARQFRGIVGGVDPASSGAACKFPSLQGRGPSSSFSGNAHQRASIHRPGPSSSTVARQPLGNQIRVPCSTSAGAPLLSANSYMRGSASIPSGSPAQSPSSQVHVPASRSGGGRRSSLSPQGGGIKSTAVWWRPSIA